jgi:hypothetical protein
VTNPPAAPGESGVTVWSLHEESLFEKYGPELLVPPERTMRR